MTYLTDHFTLEELTASQVGMRLGIDNTPTPDILSALQDTAQRMEQVRLLFGSPIAVSSGYRSPTINHLVGGVAGSAHLTGRAVDFTVAGWENLEAAQRIAGSSLDFDQVILEYGWVHISFAPQMRRQVMTKASASAPYVAGLVG